MTPHDDQPREQDVQISTELQALLVEHLPVVRAFLRLRLDGAFRARESVSDLVQSVCCEILAHPERFEPQGPAAFRAWLCNAALMKVGAKQRFHNARMRDVRREAQLAEDARVSAIVSMCGPGPLTAAVSGEEQERIERAFERLAERQREVLTLVRIVGMSHAEVAAALRITVENSRQLLNRATAAFAARWEELGDLGRKDA